MAPWPFQCILIYGQWVISGACEPRSWHPKPSPRAHSDLNPLAPSGLRCLGLPQLHKVFQGPGAPGPSTPELGLRAWVGLLGLFLQCGGARLEV